MDVAATPADHDREGGFTLIELLVTIVILGLAFTALLGGLGTAIIVSDQHRQQAVAGAEVRRYAELVASAGYTACAGPSTYRNPTGFTPRAGYPPDVTKVEYWKADTRTFVNSCPSPDAGAQRVTVRVTSTGGRAAETLVLVKRKASA